MHNGTMTTSKGGTVLQVESLSVAFENADKRTSVIEDVSLDVKAGELVAILGESGSGKTVTVRAIMNVLPENARLTAARMSFGETDLLELRGEARRQVQGRRIAMVMQDALSALNPVLRIGDQIGDILQAHTKLSAKQRRQRAIELLDMVGISSPETRVDDYPHQFSGGMRQRILIAMSIALEPDILIADEPTTALDVTVQAQILRLLHDLRQRLNMGVLLITHDIGVVMEVADRLIIMKQGKVVEEGQADDVFAKPAHEYTRELLGSVPQPGPGRVLSGEDQPLLVIDNVARSFKSGSLLNRRETRAVDGVSLDLKPGETVGIVGESGSGKSTLARMVVGLESVDSGTISFKGNDVTRRFGRGRSADLAGIEMIFQDPYSSLDPRMNIEDIITEPLRVIGEGNRASRRAKTVELLDLVGMPTDVLNRFPHQFSGGQRQRISIARALIRDPEILVCDEPVSALDVTIQAQVVDLLESIQQRVGISMLFISHDLSVVQNLAHRVLVMHHGQAVELGDVEQIFENPQEEYTRTLLSSVPPRNRQERGKLIATAN